MNELPLVTIERSAGYMGWRFLDPPHKRYTLEIVYRDKQPAALQATTAFRGPVRLLIDYCSLDGRYDGMRSDWLRPMLVMHPGGPAVQCASLASLSRLGIGKQLPFFATTWGCEPGQDWSAITLAASDF